MAKHTLGGYTFEHNPDMMSIPEKKKTVAVQKTYGGQAVFEWTAIVSDTIIEMEWDWMSAGMYRELRRLYLQTETTFNWNPDVGGSVYTVKILDMAGGYLKSILHRRGIRTGVKMLLNIRTVATYATTTTTTSTTSTTTT